MSLTITHNHAEGTLIEGTTKGDGAADALKANRWRWGRSIGCWYIPHSRDKNAPAHRINATADALRAAGFTVEILIDNTARPAADVEADKTARLNARADALADKADRKDAAAESAEARHRDAADRLPPGGEPIKLGHHSENRHRRDIDKAWDALGRSVEAHRDAEATQDRATNARAAAAARYNPVTVANRIEKLEAEARKVDRLLTGYTAQPGTPYAQHIPAAAGEARERWEAEAAQLADTLDYWRGVRAGQVASGEAVEHSRETISPGDYVRVGGITSSWWRVKRANPKTVTVEAGPSSIKANYGKITGHKTAAQIEAAQQ